VRNPCLDAAIAELRDELVAPPPPPPKLAQRVSRLERLVEELMRRVR
jgi:hypothetical protein